MERTTSELFSNLRGLVTSLVKIKQSERAWLLNNVNKAEEAGARKGYASDAVARIFSQIDGRLVTYRAKTLVTQVEYDAIMILISEIKTR